MMLSRLSARQIVYSVTAVFIVGCSVVNTAFAAEPTVAPLKQKCVQIYYDKLTNDEKYLQGRIDAMTLQNLLGHFSNIQQYIMPISSYKSGDLEKCDASFYLGSNFHNTANIPAVFYQDFLTTKHDVVWLRYGIDRFSIDELKTLWGVKFVEIFSPGEVREGTKNKPGFYDAFDYKGQTFKAYGEFDPDDSKQFVYSSDLVILNPIVPEAQQYVLSWATHSTLKTKTPYVLRNKNHWYIADMPFSYATYGDRSLILADLLFDILHEAAVNNGKHFALVRYEDISPAETSHIQSMVDMFAAEKIPFAISVIPIYRDPLRTDDSLPATLEMTKSPEFITALKYAQEHGASFLMHGVTHQYKNKKNPFSGVSGDDYEFWNAGQSKPIAEDAVVYVLNRLAKGIAQMQQAGFPVAGWLTPHYQASSLDNVIFGQVFTWNVGRITYLLNKTCNLQPLPDALTFNQAGTNQQADTERLQSLAKLKVINVPGADHSGQTQPYEIYGDYYGQRLIPENLGNIQPFTSEQVDAKRSVDDILVDAKKYTVIRDAWASIFVHSVLLNTIKENGLAKQPGDTSELQRLMAGLKALGFEFIDLNSWGKDHLKPKRPEPVEFEGFIENCLPVLAS